MSAQLDLPLETPSHVGADHTAPAWPDFTLTEASTPAAIVGWWDELVATFEVIAETAQGTIARLDAELAGLKRPATAAARRRRAELRAQREQSLAHAEAMECEGHARFESTLSEFTPRLIALLQAEGMDVPDDDEIAVGHFWDCLQRPALEYCAHLPLREIAREFARECGSDSG